MKRKTADRELRLLVIGKSGQVAQSLTERAAARELPLLAFGRPDCDLERFEELPQAADDFRPTVIINAAAYTAVDKAEADADTAFAVNAEGAGRLAAAAARRHLPFLHLSTDYVYDGSKQSPYFESDPVAPLGAYGASKLAGEQAVFAAHPEALIFRTAWVYSPFGGNFVKTMLRLACEREELNIVDDQIGSPTSALDIADALLDVAGAIARDGLDKRGGLYHLAGSGETSWYGFATAIFEASHRRGGPTARLSPIPTSAYPTPARRPANSRLDCTRLQTAFGVRLPHWRDSLETVVDRLVTKPV